jgi:hypothetical protein
MLELEAIIRSAVIKEQLVTFARNNQKIHMSLQWKMPFEELSVHELYDLLRLRSEIL